MKLNADIIFDNLSQSLKVEAQGDKKAELALERPELFDGVSREFKANHVYVSLVDRLPANPVFAGNVLIICVGGKPPMSYYTDRCVCFFIKGSANLFTVFNLVQSIFNKYDEWDAQLQNILNTSANIGEQIELSTPVFENPILVIDSSFHYLAYSSIIDTRDDLAAFRPEENNILGLNALREYLDSYGMNMNSTEPLMLSLRHEQYFSVNLFDNGVYAGNMTIPFIIRQQRGSDVMLALHLAKVIESTIKKYSTILSRDIYILKSILQDLLKCYPVDSTRLQYLEDSNTAGRYFCAKMAFGAHSNKVPVEYICNTIEASFPGSIAFEYESAIISFIQLNNTPFDKDTLMSRGNELLKSMNLKAGVSYSFSDLSMARLYYRQACVAFEIGSSRNPNLDYYKFHDYVLPYMWSHCLGEFPQELLLPKGIYQLMDHDLESQANYIQTLKTYLNNNMNITKTSKDLFIHRSTFLERLNRIKAILKVDMDDPDQRFRLLISLKIIESNTSAAADISGIEL